jgi:chemotaxis protein MotB
MRIQENVHRTRKQIRRAQKRKPQTQSESEDCAKDKADLDMAYASLRKNSPKPKPTATSSSPIIPPPTKTSRRCKPRIRHSRKTVTTRSKPTWIRTANSFPARSQTKGAGRRAAKFEKIKGDLQASSARLAELEGLMAAKEASMKKLKETLSKALNSFEGKGLTVQQKTASLRLYGK